MSHPIDLNLANRDPVSAVYKAINTGPGGGLAIIYYPAENKDFVIGEAASLADVEEAPRRVTTVSEALALPEHLVFLLPKDEAAVVEELDGILGQLLEPKTRMSIVLFLLRDGPGQHMLPHLPLLASWVRGHDPDPEALAEIDVDAERQRFFEQHKQTPEEWLKQHGGEDAQATAEDVHILYRVKLITGL